MPSAPIIVKRRLTKLGKIFLALILLFYGAAVTSQSGLLLLLIGLIGGCFAVNWSFARRNVANSVIIPPRDASLVEGSVLTQPWVLENHSSKHIEMIEAWADGDFLFRVPLVEVNDLVSVVPRLVFEKRGVYPHSQITLTSAAPFGLIKAACTLSVPGEVVVYPRIYETVSPAGTGLDSIAGGRFRGARRVNSGSHFAGVRTWQAGDALKQVHWKTTARRGEMMVKTFEEELGGRVSLVFDCEPCESARIDDAARAAASLGTATLQEGHQLEFLDSTLPEVLRLPPFSDEKALLERLARYQPSTVHHLPEIDQLWRRSVLAIVGTRFRPQWLPLIAQAESQRRTVHIFLREKMEQQPAIHAHIWEFSSQEIFAELEMLPRS